jgi:hypothetical protein
LPQRVERNEPLHLLIDSTGVKIYGEGEWLDQKHGVRSRRRWRKLHIAVDAATQEIAAVELTPDDVGDVSALPDLLDQIEAPVGSVTADGAYDGDTSYDEVLHRHPAARVIIPPRSTAILSDSWLQVSGTAERPQIDQGIGHQFHAVVPLLFELKAQQQPLEFVFPREGPFHA